MEGALYRLISQDGSVRRARLRRFIGLVLWYVYEYIYISGVVNGDIYMDFRKATDCLCQGVDHEDVAKELGVSVQ